MLRHGKDYTRNYTYALPRLDGTVILGGIREYGSCYVQWSVIPKRYQHVIAGLHTSTKTRKQTQILRRIYECLPEYFPKDPTEFDVVQDLAGIQPMRDIGARVEKEIVGRQKVIHANGIIGGGYILSFGLAQEVVDLVFEYNDAAIQAKL